ncbi:MAG: DUF1643 domain-containing protein [Planctomycetota bacterium]
MRGTASFSRCRRFRTTLTRVWDDALPTLGWVILNPSTADARSDDPTIRRCVRFGVDNAFGSIVVENLFTLRATDPRELARDAAPVGPRADCALRRLAGRTDTIVLAWGAVPTSTPRAFRDLRRERIERTLEVLAPADLRVLGRTKDGSPRHPLYARADARLRDARIKPSRTRAPLIRS